MPVPIPTPDEAARMSWRQRTRALAAARAALEALEAECGRDGSPAHTPKPVAVGRAGNSSSPVRSQGKATPRPPTPAEYDEAYGAVVRGQAKNLLASMPPDPDAGLHYIALELSLRSC